MATIDDVYNKVDALSTQVASLRELVEGMNEVFSAHVVTILNKAESNRTEIVGDINQSKTDIFELVNSQSDLLREHVTSRCTNTTNAVNGHSNQIKADVFEELTRQIGEDAGGRTLHQHIDEVDQEIVGSIGSAQGVLNDNLTNQSNGIHDHLSAVQTTVTTTADLSTGTITGKINSSEANVKSEIGIKTTQVVTGLTNLISGIDGGLHSHINTVIENQTTQTSYIGQVETRVKDAIDQVKDSVINQHAQTRNNLEAKMDMCLESSNLNTSSVAESAKGVILNTVIGNLQSAKGEVMGGIGSARNTIESAISDAVGTYSEAGQPQTLHQHIESSKDALSTGIDDVSSAVDVVKDMVISGNNTLTSKINDTKTEIITAVDGVSFDDSAIIAKIEAAQDDVDDRIDGVSSAVSTVRNTVISGNNTLAEKITGAKEDVESKIGTHRDSSSQEQTLHQHIQSLSAQTQNMEQDIQANVNTVYHKVESVGAAVGDEIADVTNNVNQKIANLSQAMAEQIQSSTTSIINAITGVDPATLLETIQQSLDAVMRNEMIKDDTERALVGALVIALVRTQLGEKKFEELTNVLERVKYAPASVVEQGMMVGEPIDSPLSVYYQLFNSSRRKPTPSRLSPEFGDANSKE